MIADDGVREKVIPLMASCSVFDPYVLVPQVSFAPLLVSHIEHR